MAKLIIEASDEFMDNLAERMLQKQNPEHAKNKTYTVADVAKIVGKTSQTIRLHISEGKLQANKNVKTYFINQKQLDDYVNSGV